MAINDQNNEKARINLEYKSKIQGGRSVKLPYRMMVLGDFSPNHAEKEKAIGDRRSWQIDKSTFTRLGTCEGSGCAHSIYIGNYGALTVTRSRFEQGTGGHYAKTRAAKVALRSWRDPS